MSFRKHFPRHVDGRGFSCSHMCAAGCTMCGLSRLLGGLFLSGSAAVITLISTVYVLIALNTLHVSTIRRKAGC